MLLLFFYPGDSCRAFSVSPLCRSRTTRFVQYRHLQLNGQLRPGWKSQRLFESWRHISWFSTTGDCRWPPATDLTYTDIYILCVLYLTEMIRWRQDCAPFYLNTSYCYAVTISRLFYWIAMLLTVYLISFILFLFYHKALLLVSSSCFVIPARGS